MKNKYYIHLANHVGRPDILFQDFAVFSDAEKALNGLTLKATLSELNGNAFVELNRNY